MSLHFDQAVVQWALTQLGAPYLWAGQGDWCVRGPPGQGEIIRDLAQLGVPPTIPCGGGLPGLAFDCAGLVKWAAKRAGSLADLCPLWNAHTLWLWLPEWAPDEHVGESHRLDFYGRPDRVVHVAINFYGRGLQLEAAGGDERTLLYSDATSRRARVQLGPRRRPDFVGSRSLLAVRELPRDPAELHARPTPPTRSTP